MYRYLSYITVTDVRAGGVQSYLPLHRWLIATNDGGQQMVLLPPRDNSFEYVLQTTTDVSLNKRIQHLAAGSGQRSRFLQQLPGTVQCVQKKNIPFCFLA